MSATASHGSSRHALKATLARSFSGALVDLDAPDWHDINLNDVGLGLSHINRWNGQTSRPLSVLEHSQVVAGLVKPALRLAARLHDGHEYIIGDGVRPYIAALSEKAGPGGTICRDNEAIKHSLDIAICRQVMALAGVQVADAAIEAAQLAAEMRSPIVKAADDLAGKIEERVFFGGTPTMASAAPYRVDAPDLDRLRADWLQDVLEECRARFGSFVPAVVATVPVVIAGLDPATQRLGNAEGEALDHRVKPGDDKVDYDLGYYAGEDGA